MVREHMVRDHIVLDHKSRPKSQKDYWASPGQVEWFVISFIITITKNKLQGNCTPKLKLSMFLCYLKFIRTLLKRHRIIMKQIVWETKKMH